ncbi:MAG: type II toxin-antitoxin system RelE/ParE family toxin [Thiopseudomonas sp.]
MKLKTIIAGRHKTIYSPITGNGVTPAFELFMDEVEGNYASSLAGIITFMELHASKGRTAFNTSQVHYVDQSEQIYQYIKGRLRVFWFEDGDDVVICTHGIVKKSQKTPQRDIDKAKRIKRLYLESKNDSRIEFIDEE